MQTTILILAFAVAAVVAQPTASNVTKTTAPIASNVTKNTAPAAPIANNSSLPSPLASNSTTSSAPAPTPAPKSCYTNMTEVSASVLAKDPFVVKKYILCPNTLFKIGFPSSDTAGAFNDGFAPVQLRSNTQILCGEDGSSANNCTVDGGQVQLLNTPNPLTMETNDNMLVQGLTFQNGGNAGAIFAQAGKNITLRDCIFKDQANTGSIALVYVYRAGNRRLAEINKIDNQNARLGHTINYYIELLTNATAMAEYKESARRARAEDRGLDSAITITRQEVLLDKCQFINNTLGITKQLGSNNGVISISSNSNDVTINKCIFRNNQLNDINIAVLSYVIHLAANSTLNMTDNCFVQNSVVGQGTVNIDTEQGFTESGNFGTVDVGLPCPFVSVGANKTEKCIDYSSTSCIADPSLTMIMPAPAPTPNGMPTPKTSGSSSWRQSRGFVGMVFAILCLIS